ncbi:MAG: hypothetical protein ACI8UR_002273 [Natronomonas sp.]|jgi:uncharacterized protein|uniref:proteasome assembly chaperone family protein n=1 Tax=Natronomonas sp. TaxID=2184060 RepID=UPI0039891288
MAHVQVHAEGVELDSPTLVEGLPGAGLVGKIAADHLVDEFDMTYFGTVHCDGLPEVAVYHTDQTDLMPPVRLYADEERDLLVLQSDIPVSPTEASGFADCVTSWLDENDVFPLYLSGIPEERDGIPEMHGVSTGDAADIVTDAGIEPPREGGVITGPTGALLSRAGQVDLDSVGLVVQTQPQFPDPEAARVLIKSGIEPITGIDVDTQQLVERADEIQDAREELAKRLHEAEDESTQANPIRGFQ